MSRTLLKQVSGFVLILLLQFSIPVAANAQEKTGTSSGDEPANGIYLVARWTEQKEDLFPLMEGELLVEHDQAELEPDSTEPVKYVTITNDNRVLFDQLRRVDSCEQEDGRYNLRISMARDSAVELERLSRSFLGRQVVTVIGGKGVTLHKIRGIIQGGQLQITRCTDDGCRVLLRKLAHE